MATYKSTRDIAKEAVENEFKRTGKGKRKRNIDSSDDDDFTNKNKRQERKNERSRLDAAVVKIKQNEPSELSRLAGKYRDRAKERQDGILSDENENAAISNRSIYDEIFDSVVAAVESGDRQQLNSIATSVTTSTVGGTIPVTPKDALKWITNNQNVAKTTFGNDVLQYLRKRYVTASSEKIQVSAAGRTLQKSVLSFHQGINADPRDRQRSWERPVEQTFASTSTTNDSGDFIIPKASVVCQLELLQKIQQCFDKRDRHMQKAEMRSKSSEQSISVDKVVNEMQANLDDSDDDIFESVGDYNPDDDDHTNQIPTTTNRNHNSGAKTQNTGLIFGENITTGSTTTTTQPAYQSDQDMESYDPLYEKVPQSLQGLSALHTGGYGGDYDDGIGLDFDDPMYDDDDDNNNNDEANSRKTKREKRLPRERRGKK